MCAPRPPLPLLCFLCFCPPPSSHTHVTSFKHLLPSPHTSFHPSLFLYSYCDLELHAARRRTKWLASLLLCSLFAVTLIMIPTRTTATNRLPTWKKIKRNKKKRWLASNLQLLSLLHQITCILQDLQGRKCKFAKGRRADWNSAGVIHLCFSVSQVSRFPARFLHFLLTLIPSTPLLGPRSIYTTSGGGGASLRILFPAGDVGALTN